MIQGVMIGWLVLGTALAAPRGVVQDAEAPTGLDDAYAARRFALIIGIDDYEDPELGDLRFAAKDGHDLAATLIAQDGGGFDHVEVLSGRVSRREIEGALAELTRTLGREDTLLFYFAGHGTMYLPTSGTELYLLASESRLDDPVGTGLKVDDLADTVSGLPARHRVMVVDACHSGTGRSALGADAKALLKKSRGKAPPPATQAVGRFEARLFAAHYDQPALEDDSLQNGVYSHYFTQALAGEGDMDGDALVDVIEAHTYAMEHTIARTQGRQTPWIETTQVGRDQIFLAGDEDQRTAAARAMLYLPPLGENETLRVDGQPRGPGPVDPGLRELQVTHADQVLLHTRTRLRPGQKVDVAALVAERDRHLVLSAGAGLELDALTLPWFSGRIVGWWLPRDPSRGRHMLGVSVNGARGPVSVLGVEPVTALTGGLRYSWTTPGRFGVGPLVEGALTARVIDGQPRPATSALVGIRGHGLVGPVWVGLEAGARLWSAANLDSDEDTSDWVRPVPSVALTIGVRP